MRIGHKKYRFDVVVHALIHGDHLEFVFEIRDGAETTDDDPGATLFREMHQQVVEWPRFDLGAVGEVARFAHHHVDALFEAKQRPFAVIDRNADDQLVDQLYGAADDVQMPIGDGIERAGKEEVAFNVCTYKDCNRYAA